MKASWLATILLPHLISCSVAILYIFVLYYMVSGVQNKKDFAGSKWMWSCAPVQVGLASRCEEKGGQEGVCVCLLCS